MYKKIPVIALEEHYWDHQLAAELAGAEGIRGEELLKRLYDLGELRIREMDEVGIDVQVISHGAPSAQKLRPEIAVDMTKGVNDRLAEACARHPTRFAGFACLPTAHPEAAARGRGGTFAALWRWLPRPCAPRARPVVPPWRAASSSFRSGRRPRRSPLTVHLGGRSFVSAPSTTTTRDPEPGAPAP